MGNIVAIVGRPNVGKSTFFNRLVGFKKAIIDDFSGITRDRHYGQSEWNGKHFTVIDTGGYIDEDEDVFNASVREQIKIAVDECDVILFLVDVATGLTEFDKDFANIIRRENKPVLVVANKADNLQREHATSEFYSLGFDKIFPISSQSGYGSGDLLDELVTHFDEEGTEDPYEGVPRIAIIGRPNVGKSSFVNALLGKERSIVTDVAGTTRDSINTRYQMYGKDFLLVDTAGIRRKSKIKDDIEFYSILRSLKALENANVCVLLIDATRGMESQDINILRQAQQNKKGMVILVNKWDLIEKDTMSTKRFEDTIKEKLAPNTHIPILFISALTKQRIFKAVDKVMEVYENMTKKVSTSKLNDVLLPEIDRHPPPALKGKHIKIKYVTQLPTNSITFAFFCNLPQYIKEPYMRYLENKVREHFGFQGVPINIVFRKK